MVGVNVQISLGQTGQIHLAVLGQLIQHMIQKPNAGFDGPLPRAIQG